MRTPRKMLSVTLALAVTAFLGCSDSTPVQPEGGGPDLVTAMEKPGGETAGNNLSFPVIWAEGVEKTLRGTFGEIKLEGEYALVDGYRAYVQKDPMNEWQAESADWSASTVYVDLIDWGDNLESVDWYTRSMVRTEVVLYQELPTPMLEYEMAHVSGQGIDEVWGLKATEAETPVPQEGPGTQATVYSHCARLTIQRLLVERENPLLESLWWDPVAHIWAEGTTPGLIGPTLFNKPVYEAGDGPGYYNAEINVKGKIIYGYTWNVRRLNDGAGDYRITFSFDQSCGGVDLNTSFAEAVILEPSEEEEELLSMTADEGTGGGATAVLDFENNLTYMDVRILPKKGGGKSSAKNIDGRGSWGGNDGGSKGKSGSGGSGGNH